MSTLKLNLDELKQRQDQTIEHRKQIFDKILQTCHNKIKKYNNDLKRQNCLFTVPPFILGFPTYNHQEVINYLIISLRDNGLYVEWMPPDVIYISWQKNDIDLDHYHRQIAANRQITTNRQEIKVVSNKSLNSKSNRGKVKDLPIQHVALIDYGSDTQDLFPINVKHLDS